jgi:hypothetical membrane protein
LVQLEQKFHKYFYSGDTELRLSHLTVIKQKHNEPVVDYIRRFRDTRNWCFNLNIYDKDFANLAYSGWSPHLKEKLESYIFSMLVKSCKGLWIEKVLPKNLEASLRAAISLEMFIMLAWSIMIASHQMMRRPTYA